MGRPRRGLPYAQPNSGVPGVATSLAFLGSLGANTKVGQGDSNSLNTTTFVANLQTIGIKWIRDGIGTTNQSTAIAVFNAVSNAGITMTCGAAGPNLVIATEIANCNAIIAGTSASYLIGYEMPNEPNGWPYTYGSIVSAAGYYRAACVFSVAMYAALRGNSATATLPVTSISEQGGSYTDSGAQWLTVPVGYNHYTVNTSATTASGNGTLHFSALPLSGINGIWVGQYVYGSNIAANTIVTAVTATTAVISPANSGAISSGQSIRFGAMVPDGAVLADIANLHVYPLTGGNSQSQMVLGALYTGGGGGGGTTSGSGVDYMNQVLLSEVSTTWGYGFAGYTPAQCLTLPKVMTEFGWCTQTPYAGAGSCDEATAGKNLINAWLNAWLEGYQRVCVYTLYDTASDGGLLWGLYTTGAVIKTNGLYLSRFTAILHDSGSTFLTGTLTYALSTSLPYVQSLMLQRSDRTYFLIIWNNNADNWNFTTGVAHAIGGTSVTVTFPRSGSIHTYDFTIGTAAQQTLASSTTVTVTVSDYAQVISFI